jgi:hypothetical protein
MIEVLAADWHSGTRLGTVDYHSLDWSDVIADAGDWSLSVDAHSVALDWLQPARTLIYIHDSERRAIVYAGIVWRVLRRPASAIVEVSGDSLFGYFKRRTIRNTFIRTATEQLAIVHALTDGMQGVPGGSLRLTVVRRPTNSGIVRDVTIPRHELKRYGEVLIDLAQLERGFEFTTGASWRSDGTIGQTITFAYPRLGRDLPYVWTDGIDVVVDAAEDDRGDFANWWRARGAGSEDEAPISDVGTPNQPVTPRGYPVLDGARTYSDVTTVAQLRARGTMDMAASHVETITASLAATTRYPLGTWTIGDSVRVVSDPPSPGGLDGSDWWRIGGYDASIDASGQLDIKLDLDRSRNNARPVLRPYHRLADARAALARRVALVENAKS